MKSQLLALLFQILAIGAVAPGSTLPGSVRIAVVQQDSNPGDIEGNRNKALRFAQEALQKQADVVLFHEALLTGCVVNPRELAEPVDGPTTQAFQRLLQGTNSLIIYGLTEKEGDKLYVSAVVVGADGVMDCYRKTHLCPAAKGSTRNEPEYYTPGDKLVTISVKGHPCGLMICYDGDFAVMTHAYASLGCEMLFWLNQREDRRHIAVKHLAIANSMVIATSCCTGVDELQRSCPGGSNITDEDGRPIAELWNREGLIIEDVPLGTVSEKRKQNRSFNQLKR